MAKHPKCPNCDLPTMRTKDWACQWCGYPLVSESFQQMEKTYQEVRAERISERAPSEKEETDVPTENAKCPNCDLPTMRTKDWACRWCGHPLLSGSFRQMSKTYQEVKAEGTPPEEEEADVPTENAKSTTSEEEAESTADVPPSQAVESDVEVAAKIEATQEPVPVEEPEPEPVSEAEETLVVETKAAPEAEPEQEQEPEPVQAADQEKASQELDDEQKPQPDTVIEEKPGTVKEHESSGEEDSEPISDVTVEELCSSYQSYGMEGHDEFKNRVFRVAGTVASIVIKDTVSQYYVSLTGSKPHPLGDIHCIFKKKDMSELKGLTIGQGLTIQGRYDGFVTSIILADCVINYK